MAENNADISAAAKKGRKQKKKGEKVTYSCKKCNLEDNTEMVQCDSCDSWFHFTCVGVDESIQDHDYICEDCTIIPPKFPSVQSPQTRSVVSSMRSNHSRTVKLQLQRLEEERALKEERNAKFREEERQMQEQRKAQQLLEDEKYIDERFKLLLQDDSDDEDPEPEPVEKVPFTHQTDVVKWVVAQSTPFNRNKCVTQPQVKCAQSSAQHPCARQQQLHKSVPPATSPSILSKYGAASHLPEVVNTITPSQLAARKALPKDLPIFSGKPDEWPMFINCFEGTTAICGITHIENIYRLQKSLKGPALEAVRSRLVFPQNVPTIIETLRMIFGRPEAIIQSLLQKVRAEPNPKSEKLESIIPFALTVDNLCSTMETCGMINHLNNPVLLQEIIEKLPAQIKLNWATYSSNIEVNLSTLSTWLMQLAGTVSSVTYNIPNIQSKTEKSTARGHVAVHNENVNDSRSSSRRRCCICDQNCAKVENCNTFNNHNTTQRWNAVKKNKLCRLCLISHLRSRCRLNTVCGINGCTYNHHRLLHNYEEDAIATAQINTHVDNKNGVLFRILPTTIHGKRGPVKVFVFLDEGSSLSLMDASLAEELELQGPAEALCLKWTGDTHRVEQHSKVVSVQISPEHSKKRYTISDIRTVAALKLPSQSICMKRLEKMYPYLKGLPLRSYDASTPRLLIGLNNWHLGNQLRYVEGTIKQPIASKTRLGWTIHGPCQLQSTPTEICTHHSFHHCECTQPSDENLHDMMNKYFSLDSLGVTANSMKPLVSQEDQRAIKIMESETVRTADDSRYQTSLLWKYDQIHLPDSFPMASRRFRCLQSKLDRNPELKSNLNHQITEYLRKGYVRKLSKEELEEIHPRIWYLPIFPVFNPKKPQKTRIVWDAAAKVNGISLNSLLLKGPDQLTSLMGVLYRFRERKVAICGDIREMYHQVRIKGEDQHSQRFLWQSDEKNAEPDVYVAQVMTFGATCSPSCAQFVKNKNALVFIEEYPRAVKCILDNHYVDDLLDCVDTEAEAIQLCNEVKRIHQHGGFEIGKWISNSSTVVSTLGETHTKQKRNLNMAIEIEADKVLGMWWCTSSDCFTYVVIKNENNKSILQGYQKPTKREVLRILMTIYDPLGLIAHFLVFLKILLQDIWRSSTDWDDQLNEEHFDRWLQWIKLLDCVEKLTIPRCYLAEIKFGSDVKTELHVFVDASSHAFAAVAYFRSTQGDYVECKLVSAKTRVAPIKLTSIPRLELEAARLGVRLAKSIVKEQSIVINRKVFWSDSKTVLSWIRADNRNYRQFVAFRVSEILELSKVEEWKYVPTKLNVADEGTKWSKKQPSFESSGRWYTGPPFLLLPEVNWPASISINHTCEEEIKPHLFVNESESGIVIDPERFSKWMRLVRSTAFMFRFIYNIRHKRRNLPRISGEIQKEEYQKAEAYICREAQLDVYANEFLTLSKQKHKLKHQRVVDKSSPIYKLSPYLDRNGVLRLYGRIDAVANVNRDVKRPIILPRAHPITDLIIQFTHEQFHHVHNETIVNELRQKFWIPHMRVSVRKVLQRCQYCKIRQAVPKPPMMGKLPPARLATYHRPFSYSGIDYFGPMCVSIGRRTEKRWGVLITCMTTRAVHIEVASSLSSDSCILAIKRFIARRGIPIEFHCDNGTNFHGAKNELQKAFNHQSDMAKRFTSATTKWIFNPPSSPHMGGTWERMVQTVKKVLQEIAPIHNPTDELLHSMLLEVEKVINCHPLTYLPLDTDEDEALTPNHFLLGSSNGQKPDSIVTDERVLRKHWLTAQQYANRFWRRWLKEYLPTITRRGKWWAPAKPIAVGDIVIVVDDTNPRNLWPKGRVIKCQADSDGQVRKVTVQTKDGIYVRPAVKIAVIDVQDGKSISTVLPGGSVAANDI